MSETEIAPAFNPADYPRHYAYETPLHAWAAGYFVVVVASFISAYVLAYNSLQQALPEHYIAFSIIGFLTAIFLGILMVHRVEVEMDADEIRVTKLFQQRVLKRHDIAGWCDSRPWWMNEDYVEIVPIRAGTKSLLLKKDDLKSLECDDTFHNWYKSFPDLNAQQRQEYYDRIASTEALGKTRDECMKNMTFSVGVLNRLRYLFITAFTLLLLLPNAYLPPLTDTTAILFGLLTVFGIIVIYRCPLLLTEPPPGLGKKTYSPFLIVSGWGIILSLWFVRDSLMNRTWPDLFEIQLNSYLITIFLILFLPLFADRNWKQVPRRLLWDLYCILLASCTFYFYGNMAFDRTAPVVIAASFEENPSWDRANTTPYIFAKDSDREGKIIDGCYFEYPGAFGTPWKRFSNCPESFQKSENTK